MPATTRTARRAEPLSKAQIVAAAIEILDKEGEDALTFRALAARLSTGSGAIYHHVADKTDLLAAATDEVIGPVTFQAAGRPTPQDGLRALALGVFDTLEHHPWVGGALSRHPWQHATVRLIEGVGRQVQALGVPRAAQFDIASAFMSYILGLASQHASRARLFPGNVDRAAFRREFLEVTAAQWMTLDKAEHPFVRQVATALPDHDDREQFIAGIDLMIAGLATFQHAPPPPGVQMNGSECPVFDYPLVSERAVLGESSPPALKMQDVGGTMGLDAGNGIEPELKTFGHWRLTRC